MAARAPLQQVSRYHLFECNDCGIQFWDPFKRLEASWYEDFYTGRLETIPPLEPGHKFFLADPRAPKEGRLLDIGCGAGNFMAAARVTGFDVTGIDWDSNAVQKGKNVLGLDKIFALSIEEYAERNRGEKFDVVSFFEVLEHQDDPIGFLNQVRQFVRPNGYIALSVPNRNRWQKGMDVTDLPPNHLTRWNPEVLASFLQRHGFEVVSCREEPISLRRTATMLSSAMPTGLARAVMGGAPPNSTEVAENPDRARETWKRQARFGKNLIASVLVRCKNNAFFLPALVCWPCLRAMGRPGIYLYCLAQWKGQ
jgi:2-polyprenyl-3-methyl-5-hydroxy-6-metoxy-1,4-benzoquinol methylase